MRLRLRRSTEQAQAMNTTEQATRRDKPAGDDQARTEQVKTELAAAERKLAAAERALAAAEQKTDEMAPPASKPRIVAGVVAASVGALVAAELIGVGSAALVGVA